MCIHCDPGVDCAHDRADDVWLTSADLRGGLASTESARHATETRREPEPVHAPALTPDGFTEALRALGRDGGVQ